MQRSVELNLKATGPTADIAMMMYGQAQITVDLARPQEAATVLERSQAMVRDFAPDQMKRFRVQWAALSGRIATLSRRRNPARREDRRNAPGARRSQSAAAIRACGPHYGKRKSPAQPS
jgi:hypothetical protein